MSASLQTELTRLLGCRYPIVQTAMGWVADSNLVIATSKAGGFGFLAARTHRRLVLLVLKIAVVADAVAAVQAQAVERCLALEFRFAASA